MPVERRSGSQQTRSVIIAVVALVIAVLGAWGMIRLASGGQGPVKVQLGDDTFDAGYATRMADQIDKDGPLLFSDVSGRGQQRVAIVDGETPDNRWRILATLMFGLLIIGALIIMANYMVGDSASNTRLVIGLAFILGGIITATQYR